MEYLEFNMKPGPEYHWCGKFVAQSPEWTHMTRALTDYEFILVTEGTLGIADDHNTYMVTPGEFLVMSPTDFQHGTKSGSCSFYWMHFTPAKLPCIPCTQDSPDPRELFLSLPRQGNLRFPERVIILLKQLMDSDRNYKSPVLNQALCSAVLAEASAQCQSMENSAALSKEQFIDDICSYLSWHIGENLSIQQLAQYFGYNEKYLTTLFKQYKGVSLKQFILQTKMERAKFALSETNQNISQIAYGLGFKDVHNFSNAFKKITEFSPSQYRQSYRKHNIFDK